MSNHKGAGYKVAPKAKSEPGALDGHEGVCGACGYAMGTSLSAREAEKLIVGHINWMIGQGR